MLQNWVGNEIGWGFDPLTFDKYKLVNFVIFWKQDGISSSIFTKAKMIKKKQENSLSKNQTLKSDAIEIQRNQVR